MNQAMPWKLDFIEKTLANQRARHAKHGARGCKRLDQGPNPHLNFLMLLPPVSSPNRPKKNERWHSQIGTPGESGRSTAADKVLLQLYCPPYLLSCTETPNQPCTVSNLPSLVWLRSAVVSQITTVTGRDFVSQPTNQIEREQNNWMRRNLWWPGLMFGSTADSRQTG